MNDDLLRKLEAAIAETERIALAAPGKAWTRDAQGHAPKVVVVDDGTGDGFVGHGFTDEAAEHFVHNDPDRVLRRVARDRKLLALHRLIHRDVGWMEDGDERMEELPVCGHCVPKHSWFKTRAEVPTYPCATVSIIAEDYEIQVEE